MNDMKSLGAHMREFPVWMAATEHCPGKGGEYPVRKLLLSSYEPMPKRVEDLPARPRTRLPVISERIPSCHGLYWDAGNTSCYGGTDTAENGETIEHERCDFFWDCGDKFASKKRANARARSVVVAYIIPTPAITPATAVEFKNSLSRSPVFPSNFDPVGYMEEGEGYYLEQGGPEFNLSPCADVPMERFEGVGIHSAALMLVRSEYPSVTWRPAKPLSRIYGIVDGRVIAVIAGSKT